MVVSDGDRKCLSGKVVVGGHNWWSSLEMVAVGPRTRDGCWWPSLAVFTGGG